MNSPHADGHGVTALPALVRGPLVLVRHALEAAAEEPAASFCRGTHLL